MNLHHEEIAKVAYELYEKSGRLEGRDEENWHEAERILMEKYASKELAKGTKRKKPAAKKVAQNVKETRTKISNGKDKKGQNYLEYFGLKP